MINNQQFLLAQNILKSAKDRQQIFQEFSKLAIDRGSTEEQLSLLYEGVNSSPYLPEINDYPNRLRLIPDGQNLTSYGERVALKESNKTGTFSLYPKLGELPPIDAKGLDFLDEDIQEACVCVGSFVGNRIQAHWLGRNALNKGQFWSATKFLPILNVVSKINGVAVDADIDNCIIRDRQNRQKNASFFEFVRDMVSYKNRIASSNSIAAMFKRFETRQGLESWVKRITGNSNLDFRGGYGEPAYIYQPEVYDLKKNRVLLNSTAEGLSGENLVTAYDLTRFISMLGWHYHIPVEAKLPNAQWISLESIVRGMGNDACRYTDEAIKKLGLQNVINSPVIISKLGNGYSNSRNRSEIVYVAMIQFVDELPQAEGNPAKLRTLAITLRGASTNAVQLDARMAAEVTEILRRIVNDELA